MKCIRWPIAPRASTGPHCESKPNNVKKNDTGWLRQPVSFDRFAGTAGVCYVAGFMATLSETLYPCFLRLGQYSLGFACIFSAHFSQQV